MDTPASTQSVPHWAAPRSSAWPSEPSIIQGAQIKAQLYLFFFPLLVRWDFFWWRCFGEVDKVAGLIWWGKGGSSVLCKRLISSLHNRRECCGSTTDRKRIFRDIIIVCMAEEEQMLSWLPMELIKKGKLRAWDNYLVILNIYELQNVLHAI